MREVCLGSVVHKITIGMNPQDWVLISLKIPIPRLPRRMSVERKSTFVILKQWQTYRQFVIHSLQKRIVLGSYTGNIIRTI